MINKFSNFEDLFLAKLNKNIFLNFYNFFLVFSTLLVSSNFGKSWTVKDRKISSFRFFENLINSPLFFFSFCKIWNIFGQDLLLVNIVWNTNGTTGFIWKIARILVFHRHLYHPATDPPLPKIKTAKKERVKQQLQKKRGSEKEGKPCSKVVQYLGYERRGNHEMMRVKLATYFLLTFVLWVKPKNLDHERNTLHLTFFSIFLFSFFVADRTFLNFLSNFT